MRQIFAIITAIFLPQIVSAHPGHEQGHFTAGLAHPVGGLDHVLAMVALGLLAAQIGGRALWILPLSFVSAMVAGGVAGWAGVPFSGVEPMILASIIILGVLIAMAVRLPITIMVPGVALFGFSHGWAHGAEGPVEGLVVYGAGFALTTMVLHLTGLVTGRILVRKAILSGLGAGTAFAGLALAMAG